MKISPFHGLLHQDNSNSQSLISLLGKQKWRALFQACLEKLHPKNKWDLISILSWRKKQRVWPRLEDYLSIPWNIGSLSCIANQSMNPNLSKLDENQISLYHSTLVSLFLTISQAEEEVRTSQEAAEQVSWSSKEDFGQITQQTAVWIDNKSYQLLLQFKEDQHLKLLSSGIHSARSHQDATSHARGI